MKKKKRIKAKKMFNEFEQKHDIRCCLAAFGSEPGSTCSTIGLRSVNEIRILSRIDALPQTRFYPIFNYMLYTFLNNTI